MFIEVFRMITVPEGVTMQVSGNTVNAKGPNGQLEKSFTPLVGISMEGNELKVEGKKVNVNMVKGLISNMIKGVTEGYKKELKVVYAHFPISIEAKGKEIIIKNFQGEKEPRKTLLIGDTKMTVKGQNITVSGPDKAAVGQTVANMRAATKIRDRDSRVFQDGVYEVEA